MTHTTIGTLSYGARSAHERRSVTGIPLWRASEGLRISWGGRDAAWGIHCGLDFLRRTGPVARRCDWRQDARTADPGAPELSRGASLDCVVRRRSARASAFDQAPRGARVADAVSQGTPQANGTPPPGIRSSRGRQSRRILDRPQTHLLFNSVVCVAVLGRSIGPCSASGPTNIMLDVARHNHPLPPPRPVR